MRNGDHLNFVFKLPEDDEVGEVPQMQTPDAIALGNSRDMGPVRAGGAQTLKSGADGLQEALAESVALPLIPTHRVIEIRFRFRR
jgi:hypothetical protein